MHSMHAIETPAVHMYECRSTTTCMHAVMKDTIIWQRAMLYYTVYVTYRMCT
jgi:uncharacterized membrane protein